jgi:monoamine oxidase
MARQLGGRVVLRSPVRRITQPSGGGVRVESDRMAVACHHVIVAVPPVLAGRIDYQPGLPPIRTGLMQRMPMGSMMKVEAVYEQPFWRADGLTGQAVTDTGPPTAIFDNTPPGGSPGILIGFVAGDQLRTWGPKAPAERRGAVLDVFAKCFGDRARQPVDYVEMDWTTEPWTGGGPVGVAVPGTLLRYGRALREPVGRIHWAGTETATYWQGYMDGAVRSGERAASEIP